MKYLILILLIGSLFMTGCNMYPDFNDLKRACESHNKTFSINEGILDSYNCFSEDNGIRTFYDLNGFKNDIYLTVRRSN